MIVQTNISPAEPPGQTAYLLKCMLDGLAEGCRYLWAGWRLPPLYETRIQFSLPQSHGTGLERFQTPLETYERGVGDCDQLIVYRIAELRFGHRINATTKCDWQGGAYHVLVRLPNGRTEDPSLKIIALNGRHDGLQP